MSLKDYNTHFIFIIIANPEWESHLVYELLIALFSMLHHVSGTSFLIITSTSFHLRLFLPPSFRLLVFHLLFHHP